MIKGVRTYDDLTRSPDVRCFFAAGMRLGVAARELATDAASPGTEGDPEGETAPSTSSKFRLTERVTLVLLGAAPAVVDAAKVAVPMFEVRVFRVFAVAMGVSTPSCSQGSPTEATAGAEPRTELSTRGVLVLVMAQASRLLLKRLS